MLEVKEKVGDKMKLYVDSDVFISSIDKTEKYHNQSKKFFEKIFETNDEYEIYTSNFTLLEMASGFARTKKQPERKYRDLLLKYAGRIKTIDPEKTNTTFRDLMENIVKTAFRYKANTGDTIHIHTIKKWKIKNFITWNKKHFKKFKEKNKINLYDPSDFLKEYNKLILKSKLTPKQISAQRWEDHGTYF